MKRFVSKTAIQSILIKLNNLAVNERIKFMHAMLVRLKERDIQLSDPLREQEIIDIYK
jgi:hypothetical protein